MTINKTLFGEGRMNFSVDFLKTEKFRIPYFSTHLQQIGSMNF